MKKLIFIKGKCKLRARIYDQKEDTCGKRLISLKKAQWGKSVKMSPYNCLLSNRMTLLSS